MTPVFCIGGPLHGKYHLIWKGDQFSAFDVLKPPVLSPLDLVLGPEEPIDLEMVEYRRQTLASSRYVDGLTFWRTSLEVWVVQDETTEEVMEEALRAYRLVMGLIAAGRCFVGPDWMEVHETWA